MTFLYSYKVCEHDVTSSWQANMTLCHDSFELLSIYIYVRSPLPIWATHHGGFISDHVGRKGHSQ